MRVVRTHAFPIVATLLARAFVNGAFAIWLLFAHATWSDVFQVGSGYALADGGLGLAMVVLLFRHKPITAPPLLVSMVLVDAVLRLGAAVAVHVFSGIADFPITLVLFFGVLGTWAAIAGVSAMAAWILTHEHHANAATRRRSRVHALFDPLTAAGIMASVVVAYAFVVGPPSTADELRVSAGAAGGVLALAFLGGAIGAAR